MYYVYILSSEPNGTLYIDVTNDLVRLVFEHREGVADGFTKRFGIKRLVFYEAYDGVRRAIQREKTMKHWPRSWKVNVI